jgi:hypothetical protein
LLWRWSYGEGNSIPFDDARKLAQSVGIDLTKEWDKRMSFIQKNSELVGILGPEDREWKDGRVEQEILESRELIDVLHYILQLWRNGKRDELVRILIDSGYGQSDVFYRVAQAISETLPNTSREKKLLDGFLAGKGRLFDDIRKTSGQKRLSEY